MIKRTLLVAAVCFAAIVTGVLAAGPRKSPPAEARATIAGKAVKIDYSAPSVRGRKIFGELVPFGKVWRTGANEATTLTTDADLKIGALEVPKGKYTLFTLPAESAMTLIVNKQTGQWGTKYDEAQDLGRVEMQLKKLDQPVEKLEIKLTGEGDKGELTIAWADRSASLGITAK